MPQGKTTGVMLDGTRAMLVTVDGSRVVTSDVLTDGTTLGAARSAARWASGSPAIRVVPKLLGLRAARTDLTSGELSRDKFTATALAATGTQAAGTTVAGRFDHIDTVHQGRLSGGMMAAAPEEAIAHIYKEFPAHTEVVPSPLVPTTTGLVLSIGYEVADLTLARAGITVAYRQVPVGGLAAVEAALGAEGNVGAQRLDTSLTGHAGGDLITLRELERYMRTLALGTRGIVAQWAARGLDCSGKITVHGPGAAFPDLPAIFDDASLRTALPTVAMAALSASNPTLKTSLVGAYWAAVSTGDGAPYSVFPRPADVRAVENRRKARSRRKRTLTAATLAALVLAAAAPAAAGEVIEHQAASSLSTARANLNATPDVSAVKRIDLATNIAGHTETETLASLWLLATETDVTLTAAENTAAPPSQPGKITLSGHAIEENVTRFLTEVGSSFPVTHVFQTGKSDQVTFTMTVAVPAVPPVEPGAAR